MSQLVTSPAYSIDLSFLNRELKRLSLENELLREKLRLVLIAKYGPASEKLNDAQLSLLEGEPGVSGEEVLAEAARGALPEAPPTVQPQGGGRKDPGRQTFSADLPRVERVISAKPEDCCCKACGPKRK